MTACTVFCYQCPTVDGRTKQFRSLCVECSETTLDNHRRETGHTDLELRITKDVAPETLYTSIGSVYRKWWRT